MAVTVEAPRSTATVDFTARAEVKPRFAMLDPLRAISALTVLVGHVFSRAFGDPVHPSYHLAGRMVYNLANFGESISERAVTSRRSFSAIDLCQAARATQSNRVP